MRRERGRFCTHVIFVSSTCRLLYAQREQLRKELHFLVVHVRDVGGAYGKEMVFLLSIGGEMGFVEVSCTQRKNGQNFKCVIHRPHLS